MISYKRGNCLLMSLTKGWCKMFTRLRLFMDNKKGVMNSASVLVLLIFSTSVRGAIVEVQPLHFGVFALVNNTTVSTLIIPYTNSNPIASAKLFPLSHGQAGHYQLSGYPAFMPLILTIADFQLTIGLAEPFTVGSFTYDPVVTDGNGDVLVKIGATMSTSGSTVNYGDAAYSGNIDIQVTW